MENLEQIGEIIVKLIDQSLLQKKYKFGIRTKPGLSNKYASGALFRSVKSYPTYDKKTGQAIIAFEMLDYWKWVQSGRIPGRKGVPISALMRWIKERKIRPKKGQTIKQLAFGIQTNIKKYGIPSEPGFMDIVVEKIYKNKEIEILLGNATVDQLIEKMEGL